MGVGYSPRIVEMGHDVFIVNNKKGEALGNIRWSKNWNCYQFHPDELSHFGPIFLVELSAQMLKMAAKRVKP